MAEMRIQDVFDAISGNLDELNGKIVNTASDSDSVKRKYVITDFSLAPTTQFGGLAVGEMATFTAAAGAVGRPWGANASSSWGYVTRTHADYYFIFANRVNNNEVAYRSSDSAGSGTWKPWVIEDGTGVAESAKKLAAGRTVQTDLASTAAPVFDGTANISPGVKGVLPVARGGTGNGTGNAATATKLATAQSFSISGGATAAAKSFDGSGDVNLEVTGLDVGKASVGTLPVARGGTGNSTGNAVSATKLATGRTVQTNLASTSAVTFDGSVNVAPGVTGILPVARGGTGNATGKAADSAKLDGKTADNYATKAALDTKLDVTGGDMSGMINFSRDRGIVLNGIDGSKFEIRSSGTTYSHVSFILTGGKEALEIYSDGSVRVSKTPVNASDVVRKDYVDGALAAALPFVFEYTRAPEFSAGANGRLEGTTFFYTEQVDGAKLENCVLLEMKALNKDKIWETLNNTMDTTAAGQSRPAYTILYPYPDRDDGIAVTFLLPKDRFNAGIISVRAIWMRYK